VPTYWCKKKIDIFKRKAERKSATIDSNVAKELLVLIKILPPDRTDF